jgi:hypothetical protein
VITFWFVLFTALRYAHLEFERTRINP